MAGIIKVNQYQDFNGNTLFTSDGSGNLTTQKTLYPAFEATITTEQNPSNTTETKINFDNKVFDTDSAYDTTNKRFTVPSGKAGKYHFYCDACIGSSANSTLNQCQTFVFQNGVKTDSRTLFNSNADGNGRYMQLTLLITMDLVVGDYIEIFCYADLDSGTVEVRTTESRFGGYRIGS